LSGRGELGNRMKLNRSKSTEGMWDRPQQPLPNDAAVLAAATRIQAVARGRQSRKKTKQSGSDHQSVGSGRRSSVASVDSSKHSKAGSGWPGSDASTCTPDDCGHEDTEEGGHGHLATRITLNRSASMDGVPDRPESARPRGTSSHKAPDEMKEDVLDAALRSQAVKRAGHSRRDSKESTGSGRVRKESGRGRSESPKPSGRASGKGRRGSSVEHDDRPLSDRSQRASRGARDKNAYNPDKKASNKLKYRSKSW
jgi:hypothetical protein